MVSGLDFRLGAGNCCVLRTRHLTLTVPQYLHPGVKMGTGKFNTWGNAMMD